MVYRVRGSLVRRRRNQRLVFELSNGDYYEKTSGTVWTLRGNLKGGDRRSGGARNAGNTGDARKYRGDGSAGFYGAAGTAGTARKYRLDWRGGSGGSDRRGRESNHSEKKRHQLRYRMGFSRLGATYDRRKPARNRWRDGENGGLRDRGLWPVPTHADV